MEFSRHSEVAIGSYGFNGPRDTDYRIFLTVTLLIQCLIALSLPLEWVAMDLNWFKMSL